MSRFKAWLAYTVGVFVVLLIIAGVGPLEAHEALRIACNNSIGFGAACYCLD